MKTLTAIACLYLLAGCNALGGIQPEAITALKDAGGGCIYVESLIMGKAVYTVAHNSKGAIRNGGVAITPNCGINITDTQTIPIPANAVITTTVVPAK